MSDPQLIRVPMLKPIRTVWCHCNSNTRGQPILQFKELAVDQVRYDQWRVWLFNERQKERREAQLREYCRALDELSETINQAQ